MISYRDNQNILSDDDSEESDKECSVWKRAEKKEDNCCNLQDASIEEDSTSELIQTKKRKKNTIWSDILQDQLISEDLGGCLLKNKPADYGNRGYESYDYTLKYALSENKNDMDCSVSDEEMLCKSEANPMVSSEKNFRPKKFVKLDGTQRAAANKIIKVLNEKKAYLIYRVVKEIGIDKAMILLQMTEQIEDAGGMMIKTNARRRTPGGVYFQLLKNDKDVTKEMIDKIFEGEMSAVEAKKFYAEMKKKKKQLIKKRKAKSRIELQKTEIESVNEQNIPDLTVSSMECTSENCAAIISEPKHTNSDLEDGELKSDDDSFN